MVATPGVVNVLCINLFVFFFSEAESPVLPPMETKPFAALTFVPLARSFRSEISLVQLAYGIQHRRTHETRHGYEW